jgi:hypothetical protein
MEKRRIIDLFSNCIFDGELSSEDAEEKIFLHLPENFIYEWREGASKLVIIPDNADYVIKIPYTGRRYWDYENEEYIHSKFTFANNTDEYFWDYCLTETLLWRIAKNENVNQIFAKERIIGAINKHPIYIQQRAEVYGYSDKYDSASDDERQKTIKHCEQKHFNIFEDELLSWQTDALEYYGEKKFDKIMSFIKKYEIGDLHDSNLGYIGEKPIILDYSDFWDA